MNNDSFASESSESPPNTSPRTSHLDVSTDDEFATVLIQHAARQLGVSLPQRNNIRGGDHRIEETLHPQGYAAELTRQIEIRRKALGNRHISIADLHVKAGDIFLNEDDQFSKAENHFTAALEIQEEIFADTPSELIPLLSKMGNMYTKHKKFVSARRMFERAAQCAAAAESNVRAEESVAAPTDNLKKRLLSWKAGDVSAHLLHNAAADLYTKSDAVIQTETNADEHEIIAVVPSVFITEEQRDRLKAPSLRSAAELRNLVSYVNDPVSRYHGLGERVKQVSATPRGLQDGDLMHASGITRDLAETIRRVRASMKDPSRDVARSLVL